MNTVPYLFCESIVSVLGAYSRHCLYHRPLANATLWNAAIETYYAKQKTLSVLIDYRNGKWMQHCLVDREPLSSSLACKLNHKYLRVSFYRFEMYKDAYVVTPAEVKKLMTSLKPFIYKAKARLKPELLQRINKLLKT